MITDEPGTPANWKDTREGGVETLQAELTLRGWLTVAIQALEDGKGAVAHRALHKARDDYAPPPCTAERPCATCAGGGESCEEATREALRERWAPDPECDNCEGTGTWENDENDRWEMGHLVEGRTWTLLCDCVSGGDDSTTAEVELWDDLRELLGALGPEPWLFVKSGGVSDD